MKRWVHYESQANKEAVPSQAQIPTASIFPVELRAEMPEVTEGKNKRGNAHCM